MPSFGILSANRLTTCHKHLQDLFNNIVIDYDCSVLEGHRSKERQLLLFSQNKSKVQSGKHNESPSLAIDIAPYINGRVPWPKTPAYWTDKEQRARYIKDLSQFYHFAGYVLSRAEILNISIRWGGDWDMDHDLRDNKFDDLVHFELTAGY